MRQWVNGGFQSTKDKISANCQESASPSNFAPAAFCVNQNRTLCLPLISEKQKIIWVHSDQINIQLDKVAELDNAFSRFPYLTQRQTASLAQRCSVHPDQIKVWFMAQRLCYGISWDAKDINRVRRKMLGQSRSKRKLHKSVCVKETVKKTKISREVKDNVESGAASKKGAMKREQPNSREKGTQEDTKEDNLNPKKKQQRSREMKTVKRKKPIPGANVEGVAKGSQIVWPKLETETETSLLSTKKDTVRGKKRSSLGTNSQGLLGSCAKSDITPLQKTYHEHSFVVQDNSLDRSPSVIFQSHVTALEKLKTTDPLTPSMPPESQTCTHPGFSVRKQEGVKTRRKITSRVTWRVKTASQLEMMKVAFAKNQYPNQDQYHQLSLVTGVPRYGLVQWFNDMRYFIKKRKPCWMSPEQHTRAVANVVRMQYLRTLEKIQTRERRAGLRRKAVT